MSGAGEFWPKVQPLQAPVTPLAGSAAGVRGSGRPGASRRAEARRVRQLEHAHRGPLWQQLAVLAVSLFGAAVVGWVFAHVHQARFAWVLVLFVVPVSLSAGRLVSWHRGPTRAVVRRLQREAQLEERTGTELERLASHGWVLLHDRLIGNTGHRVAHLAVGPNGITVVTPFAVDGPVTVAGDNLLVNGLPYTPWAATRLWETSQVGTGVASQLPDGWTVVTTQYGVAIGRAWPAELPSWHQVGLCSLPQLAHLLLSAPATLHREAVAYLASVLDEFCPPAPTP